jgi:hypothetical protein
MDEKLKSNIETEILKTGFPTELEVGKIFLKNNFRLSFNAYYIDKDEMKGREIDLIANHYRQIKQKDNYLELSFEVVIEVKNEVAKPWVVFSSESNESEIGIGLPIKLLYHNIDNLYALRCFRKEYQSLNSRIGRSAIELTAKSHDKLSSSIFSITKALYHSIESSYVNKDQSRDKLLEYIEPLIVFKGTLIEAYLDDTGKLNIEEKSYLQFKFNYLSPNYRTDSMGQIIHIVRFDYLDTYLKNKYNQINKIFSLISKREIAKFKEPGK